MSFLLFLMLAFITPCDYEDSNGCYWNASDNGGKSFIAITDDFIIPLPTISTTSTTS